MVPHEVHPERHTYVLEHVPWHTAVTSHLMCACRSDNIRIHIITLHCTLHCNYLTGAML